MDKCNHFIYGAQYYRNPTPDRSQWALDLANMRKLGLRDVKFWVQWRANHIHENEFDFSDIDELMDLALKNDLRVTLNVIFDVAPVWLLQKYPESVQIMANGQKVVQGAPGHRQLGGFPGTCYNHTESLAYRKQFMAAVVERYKDHPAMYMWDVWNEPEQCGSHRYVNDKPEEITCYCDSCRREFILWLKNKYETIERLNRVWGRVYGDFADIELPTHVWTLKDFVDFKLFHSEVMTKEANMRLQIVKSIDKAHPAYLHVVPNTSSIFNAVTGVNDFEMAKQCDVFASTNFAPPIWSLLTTSAGRGKFCYNVECHIGSGSIKMHQRCITYRDLVKDFAPQIGAGIRGFMFWQYRPEVLGHEAPAWGMTKLDGSEGSIGLAAKEFGQRVRTIENHLQEVYVPQCEIAIWKGFENELFQYASQVTLEKFSKAIANYVQAIYKNNYNLRIVDDNAIINNDLTGVKLLIMPECYCISGKLFEAVDHFVKQGGILLCEAHFGGFDIDNGRHSYEMPGCCATEKWGITETETTSSYHLKLGEQGGDLDIKGVSDDVKKALEAYGTSGKKYYPAILQDGSVLTMCERVAFLSGGEVLAQTGGNPIIVKQNRGKGYIVYCGSNIGEGADADMHSFESFLCKQIADAGIHPNLDIPAKNIHLDIISDKLIAVNNMSDQPFTLPGNYTSVFFDDTHNCVLANTADILIKSEG